MAYRDAEATAAMRWDQHNLIGRVSWLTLCCEVGDLSMHAAFASSRPDRGPQKRIAICSKWLGTLPWLPP
jgi:hypothetical protein